MNQLHPAAKAYLRCIRRQLDAPGKDRERLLSRLSHAVSTYCEENPEAAVEDIADVFGDPAGCAAELMSECDPAELSRARRNRRWRLYAVIAVLAALLIASAVLCYDLAAHQIDHSEITITEYVTREKQQRA